MLKMDWLNENGETKCTVCGRTFAVPDGEVSDTVCEECASVAAAKAEADIKSNSTAAAEAAAVLSANK